jgi:hypothetical protein
VRAAAPAAPAAPLRVWPVSAARQAAPPGAPVRQERARLDAPAAVPPASPGGSPLEPRAVPWPAAAVPWPAAVVARPAAPGVLEVRRVQEPPRQPARRHRRHQR